MRQLLATGSALTFLNPANGSAGGFNEYLKRTGSVHPHLNKLVEFIVASITGAFVSLVAISFSEPKCYVAIGM